MKYKYIIEFNKSKNIDKLILSSKKNKNISILFSISQSKNLFIFNKFEKINKIISINGLFLKKNSKVVVKNINKRKREKIIKTIRKIKTFKHESILSVNKIIKELNKIKYNKIGDLKIYKTNKNFYKIFDKEFNYLKSIR